MTRMSIFRKTFIFNALHFCFSQTEENKSYSRTATGL